MHYTMNADGTKTLHLDAEGSEYLVSPYKHPLRNRVRSTAVFDEFVYTQDWAESFYPYYENYCLNSTAVFDMTDGYFSRIPKRVSAQIGNNPEITLQKWEGYFMTGKDGNNAAVTVDAKSFAVCWADLVVNKMDILAEEYSKLVLQ